MEEIQKQKQNSASSSKRRYAIALLMSSAFLVLIIGLLGFSSLSQSLFTGSLVVQQTGKDFDYGAANGANIPVNVDDAIHFVSSGRGHEAVRLGDYVDAPEVGCCDSETPLDQDSLVFESAGDHYTFDNKIVAKIWHTTGHEQDEEVTEYMYDLGTFVLAAWVKEETGNYRFKVLDVQDVSYHGQRVSYVPTEKMGQEGWLQVIYFMEDHDAGGWGLEQIEYNWDGTHEDMMEILYGYRLNNPYDVSISPGEVEDYRYCRHDDGKIRYYRPNDPAYELECGPIEASGAVYSSAGVQDTLVKQLPGTGDMAFVLELDHPGGAQTDIRVEYSLDHGLNYHHAYISAAVPENREIILSDALNDYQVQRIQTDKGPETLTLKWDTRDGRKNGDGAVVGQKDAKLKIEAKTSGGTKSTTMYTTLFTVDNQAPEGLETLVPKTLGDSFIEWQWERVLEPNFSHYELRQGNETVEINDPGDTYYRFDGLNPLTSYTAELTAYDIYANEVSVSGRATTLEIGAIPEELHGAADGDQGDGFDGTDGRTGDGDGDNDGDIDHSTGKVHEVGDPGFEKKDGDGEGTVDGLDNIPDMSVDIDDIDIHGAAPGDDGDDDDGDLPEPPSQYGGEGRIGAGGSIHVGDKTLRYASGLMDEGYSSSLFKAPFSRSKAVALCLAWLQQRGHISEYDIQSQTYLGYSDMDINALFGKEVALGTKLGIVRGYPDGSFHPNKNPSLVEIYQMIVEFSSILSEDAADVLDIETEKTLSSPDWFMRYLKVMQRFGVEVAVTYDDLSVTIDGYQFLELINHFFKGLGVPDPLAERSEVFFLSDKEVLLVQKN